MAYNYNHLSPEERGQIESYLREGVSQAEIARRLDRQVLLQTFKMNTRHSILPTS